MIDVYIKFVGIDDWSRPVFQVVNTKNFVGDVNKLWTFNELGENNSKVNEYYKNNTNALEYFGKAFNCEPHGGIEEKWNFIIIE